MKLSIFAISMFFTFSAFSQPKASILTAEYHRLRDFVSNTEADGVVGGLYPFIQMDGYKVLFSKSFDNKHETIRIFLPGQNEEKDFSITYIKSQYFQKGKTILRRFIGPEPTGWRMDQVNFETMEYLGMQGPQNPSLSKKAREIIAFWKVVLF